MASIRLILLYHLDVPIHSDFIILMVFIIYKNLASEILVSKQYAATAETSARSRTHREGPSSRHLIRKSSAQSVRRSSEGGIAQCSRSSTIVRKLIPYSTYQRETRGAKGSKKRAILLVFLSTIPLTCAQIQNIHECLQLPCS